MALACVGRLLCLKVHKRNGLGATNVGNLATIPTSCTGPYRKLTPSTSWCMPRLSEVIWLGHVNPFAELQSGSIHCGLSSVGQTSPLDYPEAGSSTICGRSLVGTLGSFGSFAPPCAVNVKPPGSAKPKGTCGTVASLKKQSLTRFVKLLYMCCLYGSAPQPLSNTASGELEC